MKGDGTTVDDSKDDGTATNLNSSIGRQNRDNDSPLDHHTITESGPFRKFLAAKIQTLKLNEINEIENDFDETNEHYRRAENMGSRNTHFSPFGEKVKRVGIKARPYSSTA